VHVVEADLVRKGNWRVVLRPHSCPLEAVAEYRAVIRCGRVRGAAYVYPWSIQKPLELIPIPLRPNDPACMLDIQRLLNEVYEENRYDRSVDYSEPPNPPLSADIAHWVSELLRSSGMLRK